MADARPDDAGNRRPIYRPADGRTPVCRACGARVPAGTGLRTAGGVFWCRDCAPAKVARQGATGPQYKAREGGS